MNATDTRTDQELAADPHAFDAKLAGLYEAWEKATRARKSAEDTIHALAGDRKEYLNRRGPFWRRTLAEVVQTAKQLRNAGERGRMNIDPGKALADWAASDIEVARAMLDVGAMEKIYREAPWPRYFPCENRDGHIHSSYRDCPTVGWSTAMAWRPDLSGLTVEQAVEKLGYALCSVCFPAAPVLYKSKTLGEVADERTADERAARQAERDAIRYAKRLFPAEVFVVEGVHERIETVAACLEVLRKEVEFRDYYGHGAHPWHPAYVTAAEKARHVLLSRESEHEGWGRTEEQITKVIASAVKRNIRDGARLDPVTGKVVAS